MTTETITEKWAVITLKKCNWNTKDEYKRLEIMNCIADWYLEVTIK